MREIEATITEPFVLVSSLETSDGGKSGILSEVSRGIAAKVIAEGRAVLASEVEIRRYADEQAAARKAAEKAELAKRLQVAILAEPAQSEEASQPKASTPKK